MQRASVSSMTQEQMAQMSSSTNQMSSTQMASSNQMAASQMASSNQMTSQSAMSSSAVASSSKMQSAESSNVSQEYSSARFGFDNTQNVVIVKIKIMDQTWANRDSKSIWWHQIEFKNLIQWLIWILIKVNNSHIELNNKYIKMNIIWFNFIHIVVRRWVFISHNGAV